MKWRQSRDNEWVTGYPMHPTGVGGEVYRDHDGLFSFWACTRDAGSMNTRTYKTLKAAQRAVERWLEKHG
jgi:hypothetical protein